MVKNITPGATEIVRGGRIAYVLHGKDFLFIRPSQSHVELLFVCGTTCSSRLLTGRGSVGEPSHVTIKNMSDFNESELMRLLKDAERIAKL
jgi:hypothetical protein